MIARIVGPIAALSFLVSCPIFAHEAFAQQEIIVAQAGGSFSTDGPKIQKQAVIPTLPNLPPGKGWYLLCIAKSTSGGTEAEISGFGTLLVSPAKEEESLTRLVDFDAGKSLTVTLEPWPAGPHPKTDALDIFVSIKMVALTDAEAHKERERLSEESKRNASGS